MQDFYLCTDASTLHRSAEAFCWDVEEEDLRLLIDRVRGGEEVHQATRGIDKVKRRSEHRPLLSSVVSWCHKSLPFWIKSQRAILQTLRTTPCGLCTEVADTRGPTREGGFASQTSAFW